jgi:hypothetical protein
MYVRDVLVPAILLSSRDYAIKLASRRGCEWRGGNGMGRDSEEKWGRVIFGGVGEA